MKLILTMLTAIVILMFSRQDVPVVQVVHADLIPTLTPTSSPINMPNNKPDTHESTYTPSSDVESLICQIFGDECEIAIAISRAESGLDCSKRSYQANTNGTYDHGLFQINDIHRSRYPDADFYDCVTNARIAKEIRDSWQGWHAWSVYNSGSYITFLK